MNGRRADDPCREPPPPKSLVPAAHRKTRAGGGQAARKAPGKGRQTPRGRVMRLRPVVSSGSWTIWAGSAQGCAWQARFRGRRVNGPVASGPVCERDRVGQARRVRGLRGGLDERRQEHAGGDGDDRHGHRASDESEHRAWAADGRVQVRPGGDDLQLRITAASWQAAPASGFARRPTPDAGQACRRCRRFGCRPAGRSETRAACGQADLADREGWPAIEPAGRPALRPTPAGRHRRASTPQRGGRSTCVLSRHRALPERPWPRRRVRQNGWERRGAKSRTAMTLATGAPSRSLDRSDERGETPWGR